MQVEFHSIKRTTNIIPLHASSFCAKEKHGDPEFWYCRILREKHTERKHSVTLKVCFGCLKVYLLRGMPQASASSIWAENSGFSFHRGQKSPCFFYRAFSRDVIIFQNPKLKSHQSFYPHQAEETENLYLFTILQLDSVLRFEINAF